MHPIPIFAGWATALALVGGTIYITKLEESIKKLPQLDEPKYVKQVSTIFTNGGYAPHNTKKTQAALTDAMDDIQQNCLLSFDQARESGNYHGQRVQDGLTACSVTKAALQGAYDALEKTKNSSAPDESTKK